ncbi:MAG TPA: hypothetical protein VIC05_11805 [Solirubrobacteraceae bacterium]
MGARRRDRRGQARKRRSAARPSGTSSQLPVSGAQASRKRKSRGLAVAEPGSSTPKAKPPAIGGEADDGRPRPPWYPLPLSEILIFVGVIATVIAFLRGLPSSGPPVALIAGIGAVTIGTLETMWRDHWGGYRSHTIMFSLLPAVVFHTTAVLVASTWTTVTRGLIVALLPVDLIIVVVMFRLLRARFIDARHQRLYRGGRARS